MILLTVVVDDLIPGGSDEDGPDALTVQFRWFAVDSDKGATANDSGSLVLIGDDNKTASVMNQKIFDSCVEAAKVLGVDVGLVDRKVMLGGFV